MEKIQWEDFYGERLCAAFLLSAGTEKANGFSDEKILFFCKNLLTRVV